tara:strand:- start:37670 stop:42949 length:5280 start_codon:yes stop_codon:yes gene_type:complete
MAADDTKNERDESGLKILATPEGVVSVVTPIDKSSSVEAAVVAEPEDDDLDGVEELGVEELGVEELGVEELDIEEFDEIELLEEDETAAATAPPPMPAPPPPLPPKRGPSEIAVSPPKPPAPTAAAPPLEFHLVEPASISALDALLDGRGKLDWERRAEKLTKELAITESKSRTGELAYELGELYQRYLHDEASAVKAFGRALQADPSLRANLWAIRRIFYRRELWPNLVKLIGAELRFATNDRQRADLHLERGRILLTGVGEPTAAQEAFEQALALYPGSHSALLALETLAAKRGDQQLLHRTLEQLACATEVPERKVAILVELAREFRLGNQRLDEARALLAQAAELDCLHSAVDREREALARQSDDSSALAACLEARIGRLQESFGLAGLPTADAMPAESGAGQRLREILALRREQAQVLVSGGDADGAWNCLHQALSLSPQEPILLADLSDLAERLGRYEELAELVEARESGEVDPGRAIGLALRRASALAKAGKQDEADEVLASRARSTPGYLPLLVARELGAGRSQNWAKMAALQSEMAETLRLGTAFGAGADTEPEPQAAATHYVVAGDLYRYGAEDADSAIASYRLALEVHPASETATAALAELHLAAGRPAIAAQLLETQLTLASCKGEFAEAIGTQLAALHLASGNTEGELKAVEALLAKAPTDLGLQGRRVELLRDHGNIEAFSDAAFALAKALTDRDAKAYNFFAAGRGFSLGLSRWDTAATCFAECRELWPDDTIVAELELDALRQAENWDGLQACLSARIERCSDDEVVEYGREALWVAEFANQNAKAACELASALCLRAPDSLPLLLDALACFDRAGADPLAVVEVLERIVDASVGEERARALLRLGMVSRNLGREAEAEQAFRTAGEEGQVAGWVALYRGAALCGDAELKGEALAALAASLEDSSQRSELLASAAWSETLRGNDEKAVEQFEHARSEGEDPVGALLGLSLLAAKNQDAQGQGEFLEALAGATQGAYAQSSLLLHAAMLAEVQGDEATAGKRLRKARTISPQDAGTAVMLADRLAPLSPEGEDSVAELLERSELCDMRSVLADAGSARVDWELERAEALELAGHLQEAIAAVASVLDMRPGHIRGLQTLRRVCIRGGDRANQARACVALARQIGDEDGRVELFREAAAIFDRELDETAAAVATYQALLAELPGAPEYERLVEILAEHDDTRTLYRVHSARLKYLSAQGEQRARVPILESRAELRKGIGDLRGAARDLAFLLVVEPTHLEALSGRAELLQRLGDDREAAELLKAYLEVEDDPTKRAAAELTLSHLMADSLDDLQGAIEQLEHVVRQSPHDLEVRERLLSLLIKAKRVDEASVLIREMASMRKSDGERARDELRVASLLRDAGNREAAVASLRRARQYDPLNVEALSDLIELSGGEAKTRSALVESAVADLRNAISDEPAEAALYEKLAIVAQWGELGLLERQALQALEVVGSLSSEQETALKRLGKSPANFATVAGDEIWRSALVHRDAGGFASQLWQVIGPAVATLSGATPDGLGFDRSHRLKGKHVAKEVPEVATLAAHLGVDGLEVYRSNARGEVARSITGETPTLCLGGALAKASTPEHRFAIGRCLAHAKAGSGSAADLAESDLDSYFAAAAELAGVQPVPAVLAERTKPDVVAAVARRMAKALSRRARKDLTALAPRFAELGAPIAWRVGTEQTAARTGLAVCGSLSAAMDILDVGKGGRPLADAPVGRELLSWSVGEQFLAMLRSGDEAAAKQGGNDV